MHECRVTFTKDNVQKTQLGKKTATSRRRMLGKVGTLFPVGMDTYEFTAIELLYLEEVAVYHYREEGCESPQQFRAEWTTITNSYRKRYAKKGKPYIPYFYDPHELVYFHVYRRVRRLMDYSSSATVNCKQDQETVSGVLEGSCHRCEKS